MILLFWFIALLLCLDLTFCLDFADSSLLQKWQPLWGSMGLPASWPGCPAEAYQLVVKAHSYAGGALGAGSGGQRAQDRSSGELTSVSGLGPHLLHKSLILASFVNILDFPRACLYPLFLHPCCLELRVEVPCNQSPLCLSARTPSYYLHSVWFPFFFSWPDLKMFVCLFFKNNQLFIWLPHEVISSYIIWMCVFISFLLILDGFIILL